MATTYLLKVVYHFETSGKKSSCDYSENVAVTANDAATIKGKLTGTGVGTLVIDSVSNIGTGIATS